MSKATPSEVGTAPVHGDIDELVTAVLTASRVLVGVSARSLAEVEGKFTLTQFRTLVVLDNHQEINLNTLADLLSVTSSTAMRMIDRLLAAGVVTRRDNPGNRREVLLGVTEEGRRLVRVVTEDRRTEIARIVAAMPGSRRTELVLALRAFAEAAHEPEPRPESTAALGW
ncbi:MAG: MarR family winged helix-turn-helix transcriptional regulator [Cellulomonas sp.]